MTLTFGAGVRITATRGAALQPRFSTAEPAAFALTSAADGAFFVRGVTADGAPLRDAPAVECAPADAAAARAAAAPAGTPSPAAAAAGGSPLDGARAAAATWTGQGLLLGLALAGAAVLVRRCCRCCARARRGRSDLVVAPPAAVEIEARPPAGRGSSVARVLLETASGRQKLVEMRLARHATLEHAIREVVGAFPGALGEAVAPPIELRHRNARGEWAPVGATFWAAERSRLTALHAIEVAGEARRPASGGRASARARAAASPSCRRRARTPDRYVQLGYVRSEIDTRSSASPTAASRYVPLVWVHSTPSKHR